MKYLSHILPALILICSLLLSSCATVTSYELGASSEGGTLGGNETVHLFLGYAVGEQHIQTSCPDDSKAVRYRVHLMPYQWWLGLLTLWFYSPMTASYWCE